MRTWLILTARGNTDCPDKYLDRSLATKCKHSSNKIGMCSYENCPMRSDRVAKRVLNIKEM